MSCTYYAEKYGYNYCTAKGDYISCYCSYDDESCRYYPKSAYVENCDCPYWKSGNYCKAKGGYVSGSCDNYTSCVYYLRATRDDEDDDDTSSGGCYLTTACVSYKGLADDCYELQLLRKYRDTYLSSFKEGKKDIKKYYQIAPIIVAAINAEANAEEIWEDIYANLVCKCVELIDAKKYSEAHYYYKDFSMKLYKKCVQEKGYKWECLFCTPEEVRDVDVTMCPYIKFGRCKGTPNGKEKSIAFCAYFAKKCVVQD